MNKNTQPGSPSMAVPENHEPCDYRINAEEGEALTRRDFLKLGMAILGSIAALEAGTAGLLYFRSHSMQGEFGAQVTAGHVDDFSPGSVTEFAEARFFLIRVEDGGFLAIHSRCPHLGCTVQWLEASKQFLCPCHASKFDAHGDYGNPPVARPLDIFPITIEKGQITVDTTQLTQRTSYSPDQLTRA